MIPIKEELLKVYNQLDKNIELLNRFIEKQNKKINNKLQELENIENEIHNNKLYDVIMAEDEICKNYLDEYGKELDFNSYFDEFCRVYWEDFVEYLSSLDVEVQFGRTSSFYFVSKNSRYLEDGGDIYNSIEILEYEILDCLRIEYNDDILDMYLEKQTDLDEYELDDLESMLEFTNDLLECSESDYLIVINEFIKEIDEAINNINEASNQLEQFKADQVQIFTNFLYNHSHTYI